MKTVFTNNMVAHVWAQRNQPSGRNSNSTMRFEGAKFYSYSTLIAHIIHDRAGNDVVLLNKEHYSNTTTQHVRACRDATSNLPHYDVDHLFPHGSYNGLSEEDWQNVHKRNVYEILKSYKEDVALAMRAQRPNGTRRISNALDTLNRARLYHDRFYSGTDIVFPNYEDAKIKFDSMWAVRDAKAADPKVIAKRERAQQKKNDAIRKEYRGAFGEFPPDFQERELRFSRRAHVLSLFTDEDKSARAETLKEYMEEQRQKYRNGEIYDYSFSDGFLTEEDHELHHAAVCAKNAAAVEAYCNGESRLSYELIRSLSTEQKARRDVSMRAYPEVIKRLTLWLEGDYYTAIIDLKGIIPTEQEEKLRTCNLEHKLEHDIVKWRAGGYVRDAYQFPRTLLRVKNENVETSRGATFPAEHARRAWPFIIRGFRNGYKRNGHTIHLGSFAIDGIDREQKLLFAGCHTVTYDEVLNCANLLGLTVPVDDSEVV